MRVPSLQRESHECISIRKDAEKHLDSSWYVMWLWGQSKMCKCYKMTNWGVKHFSYWLIPRCSVTNHGPCNWRVWMSIECVMDPSLSVKAELWLRTSQCDPSITAFENTNRIIIVCVRYSKHFITDVIRFFGGPKSVGHSQHSIYFNKQTKNS